MFANCDSEERWEKIDRVLEWVVEAVIFFLSLIEQRDIYAWDMHFGIKKLPLTT